MTNNLASIQVISIVTEKSVKLHYQKIENKWNFLHLLKAKLLKVHLKDETFITECHHTVQDFNKNIEFSYFCSGNVKKEGAELKAI